MNRLLAIILIAFILGACSQKGGSINAQTITLTEVINVIEEEGLGLKDAKLQESSAFVQELNGVSPKAYYLDGSILSIYVFSSAEDREEGAEAFEKVTATASLELYKTFTEQNVLIFYVEGRKKLNDKLATAIEGLGYEN